MTLKNYVDRLLNDCLLYIGTTAGGGWIIIRKKEDLNGCAWELLRDRHVLNVYQHQTKPLGQCVLVEGNEIGAFWFPKEMEGGYDEWLS